MRKEATLASSGFRASSRTWRAPRRSLAAWSEQHGLPMLRFDYSGHGLSEGDLLEASIGDWLEEASAMFRLLLAQTPRAILIGSSMGGWIALLLARKLAQ